jgi:N-acetylglucosamine kinase-like BadF-type ATPase
VPHHRAVPDPTPLLVGVDAGATKSVAVAATIDGARIGRAERGGANPKRHGLARAAATIASLTREVSSGGRVAGLAIGVAQQPALLFVAGAGIDRPEHARALESALADHLPQTRVIVVNDTLAVLRAATPDAVGIAIPVSTGGNVIGRAPDGRVTDRGHGVFGGAYVLGALAARAARAGRVQGGSALARPVPVPTHALVGEELAREITAVPLDWQRPRRPAPGAAALGAAVARAAEAGDPYPARMVDRWCRRVTAAVREEVAQLDLGDAPTIVVYGGLAEAVPWLATRIAEAARVAAPGARLVAPDREPVEGAVDLALDAWGGSPIGWSFTPRR